VTVSAFVGLTALAVASSYQFTSPWLDRYATPMTAVALITIEALIATKVL
jgi:hypothetical protein